MFCSSSVQTSLHEVYGWFTVCLFRSLLGGFGLCGVCASEPGVLIHNLLHWASSTEPQSGLCFWCWCPANSCWCVSWLIEESFSKGLWCPEGAVHWWPFPFNACLIADLRDTCFFSLSGQRPNWCAFSNEGSIFLCSHKNSSLFKRSCWPYLKGLDAN